LGEEGDDELWGGSGDDALYGSAGADLIVGEMGNDGGFGGEGDDRIYGMDGNDLLVGEAGADQLFGGAGDDLIVGMGGADVLVGEGGADTFRFDALTDSSRAALGPHRRLRNGRGPDRPQPAQPVRGPDPDADHGGGRLDARVVRRQRRRRGGLRIAHRGHVARSDFVF
jgi:hypothetical protein